MHICLITPYGAEQRGGNWHTTARWADMLRDAGHRVDVSTHWNGEHVDLMIALHARRSALSIQTFAAWQPKSPLVVVLTGTDLYRDIQNDADAQKSLELAHGLVVLQESALDELSPEHRAKTRVIYQSSPEIRPLPKRPGAFTVLVVGHLREEKDPFRTALASAYLPDNSRIRILHMGRALSDEMANTAKSLTEKMPRYQWLGDLPHETVLEHFAKADLLVVSSLMEGGANVICEALAAGVPIIASGISGNIGMLGNDYPGFFPVGDEQSLAQMLTRAETDPEFYSLLLEKCRMRRALMTPEHEADSLRELVTAFDAGTAEN